MPPCPPTRYHLLKWRDFWGTTARFHRRCADGFTLVELLTVIAIVGILAGILIPVVGKVRDSARASQCASNLRQLQLATLLYTGDHRDTFPFTRKGSDGSDMGWWQEVFPYCPDKDVFRCPADNIVPNPVLPATWTYKGQTFPNGKVSYGAVGHTNGPVSFKAMGKKTTQFPHPSRTALYTECQHEVMRLGEWWNSQSPRWVSEVTFPHHSAAKANFVFMDGHIARFTEPQLTAAISEGRLIFDPDKPGSP